MFHQHLLMKATRKSNLLLLVTLQVKRLRRTQEFQARMKKRCFPKKKKKIISWSNLATFMGMVSEALLLSLPPSLLPSATRPTPQPRQSHSELFCPQHRRTCPGWPGPEKATAPSSGAAPPPFAAPGSPPPAPPSPAKGHRPSPPPRQPHRRPQPGPGPHPPPGPEALSATTPGCLPRPCRRATVASRPRSGAGPTGPLSSLTPGPAPGLTPGRRGAARPPRRTERQRPHPRGDPRPPHPEGTPSPAAPHPHPRGRRGEGRGAGRGGGGWRAGAHLAEAAAVILAVEEGRQAGGGARRHQRLQLLTEPLRFLIALVFRHAAPAALRVPSTPPLPPPRHAGRGDPLPGASRPATPTRRPPIGPAAVPINGLGREDSLMTSDLWLLPSTRRRRSVLRLEQKSLRYFVPALPLAAPPVCYTSFRGLLPATGQSPRPLDATVALAHSDWPEHASITALTPAPHLQLGNTAVRLRAPGPGGANH